MLIGNGFEEVLIFDDRMKDYYVYNNDWSYLFVDTNKNKFLAIKS